MGWLLGVSESTRMYRLNCVHVGGHVHVQLLNFFEKRVD